MQYHKKYYTLSLGCVDDFIVYWLYPTYVATHPFPFFYSSTLHFKLLTLKNVFYSSALGYTIFLVFPSLTKKINFSALPLANMQHIVICYITDHVKTMDFLDIIRTLEVIGVVPY